MGESPSPIELPPARPRWSLHGYTVTSLFRLRIKNQIKRAIAVNVATEAMMIPASAPWLRLWERAASAPNLSLPNGLLTHCWSYWRPDRLHP